MSLNDNYLELVEELIELAQEHAKPPPEVKSSRTIDPQRSTREPLIKQIPPTTKEPVQSQTKQADRATTKLTPSQRAFIFSEIFNRKY